MLKCSFVLRLDKSNKVDVPGNRAILERLERADKKDKQMGDGNFISKQIQICENAYAIKQKARFSKKRVDLIYCTDKKESWLR